MSPNKTSERTEYVAKVEKTVRVHAASKSEARRKVASNCGDSTIEIEEADPIPTSAEEAKEMLGGPVAAITFVPQKTRVDYIVPAQPEGETTFYVPAEDATDEDGAPLKDDSYDSDPLRYHENAPTWMAEWDGPFAVKVWLPFGRPGPAPDSLN